MFAFIEEACTQVSDSVGSSIDALKPAYEVYCTEYRRGMDARAIQRGVDAVARRAAYAAELVTAFTEGSPLR